MKSSFIFTRFFSPYLLHVCRRKYCTPLHKRTLGRWKRQSRIGNGLKDRCKEAADRHVPANKLTEEEKTRIVHEIAKTRNPQRWSGKIRNWSPVNEVWLNPSEEIRA
uniref:Transposase n=1 Tax=Candidatus Kentrum sp. TC TaxID=2126339 RepID=A0A450Z5T9_9GAMM|nr:MAG: hypothetical protein BECKTC1821E_GA0114239_11534 [Candidatus Kentron sp. TC]